MTTTTSSIRTTGAAATGPAADATSVTEQLGPDLRGLLRLVATVALRSPRYAAQVTAGLDADTLLTRDPVALARMLTLSPQLQSAAAARTTLPALTADTVPAPGQQWTAAQVAAGLLSASCGAAAVAALPTLLTTPLHPVPDTAAAPAAAPAGTAPSMSTGTDPTGATDTRRRERRDATDKQLRYAERREQEARQKATRLSGQLTHAHTERDTALARAQTAESDLSDTQAQLLAARSDASAARRAAQDVLSAARVLLTATQPAPVPVEDDPRVREQQLLTGTTAPPSAPDTPADARVAAALTRTGLSPQVLREVLQTLLSPPAAPVTTPATTRQREFVVTPLGGGTEIGGSCTLVEVGDTRILVDAGMRPKKQLNDAGPPLIAQALAQRIDAIVITHAHNDHAGYVPAVLAAQPHIPIFTTTGTAALLGTMWADSITVFGHQLREHDSRRAPRSRSPILSGVGYGTSNPGRGDDDSSGDGGDRAPYTTEQWRAARERVIELALGRVVTLREGVTLELFPAGHVLGACGVVIAADGRRVTVTGDVSDLPQASVGGLIVPGSAVGSDLLVIESTYCRRPDGHTRQHAVEAFLSTVRETVDSGGRVLVPAFALGRAQEVALLLRDRLPDVPVLLDGMAMAISEIYQDQTAGTDRPLLIFGDNVERVRPGRRPQTIEQFRRGVVVTTSGMLSAGPAVPWAKAILPDPKSALLIAGYQDEESPGHALLELANDGTGSRQFQLDGQPVPVGARVAKFSLSAHADRTGLTSIIDQVTPERIMLVHGLASSQRDYREVLKARGNRPVPTDVWAAP